MDSRAAISAGVYYSTMPRLDKFHDDPKMARDNALERNLKRALSFEATQPPTSVSISTLAYELTNEQPVPSMENAVFLRFIVLGESAMQMTFIGARVISGMGFVSKVF